MINVRKQGEFFHSKEKPMTLLAAKIVGEPSVQVTGEEESEPAMVVVRVCRL